MTYTVLSGTLNLTQPTNLLMKPDYTPKLGPFGVLYYSKAPALSGCE